MELSADAFWKALAQGVGQLRNRADGRLADVEAVTFATQTNSFVLLDAGNQPLTPIILWPDRRAAELEAEVRKRFAMPGILGHHRHPPNQRPVHGGQAALA